MSRRRTPAAGFFRRVPAPGTRRDRLRGYAIAVLAATAAIATLLIPAVGRGMGTALFLAVVVSALYGGLRPGLLATALAAAELVAVLWYYRLPFVPAHYVGLTLFTAGGVLATLLVEALHAARRRAEEGRLGAEAGRRWLDAVLNSIGDAVVATDPGGNVTFTNPVARELTGWGEGEAEGRPLADVYRVVSGTDRRPAESPVARVIREGVVVGPAEHTALIAMDGTERPIEDSAAPIREGGAVEGVVLVFRDVTERRRAEAERERLMAALQEHDRLKDDFLAMLAHELRNPMAAIGNALKLAARSGGGEDAGWAIEVIGRQSKHLTRLVDDLLDVSRINRGTIELKTARVDAATALAGAVDAVGPIARGRGHELVGEFPRGELWVDADPTRLEQVVVNLLTNAVMYTEGKGLIRLTASGDGGGVVIAVRDNGVGIAPDLLPRVFDLFSQADRSLARTRGGLGIGLTVVKSLVEMHGGTVRATSDGPGLGSEFVVRLPAAEGPTEPRAGEASAATPPPRGARVLVTDDNKDVVRGLTRLLKSLGHDVRGAYGGLEAIEAARAHAPEFVLLDIGMPGMDGYEVAARLREEPCCSNAVLIAVTGYGRDEDRRRSRAAGFDHHLVKPLDHDALISLLSSPARA